MTILVDKHHILDHITVLIFLKYLFVFVMSYGYNKDLNFVEYQDTWGWIEQSMKWKRDQRRELWLIPEEIWRKNCCQVPISDRRTESQHTSIHLQSPSCFKHAGLSQNYTQENANQPSEADNMCACHWTGFHARKKNVFNLLSVMKKWSSFIFYLFKYIFVNSLIAYM